MRIIDIAMYIALLNIVMAMTNGMITFIPEFAYLNYQKTGFLDYNTTLSDFSTSTTNAGMDIQVGGIDIQQVFSYFNIMWKGFILMVSVVVNVLWSIIGGFYVTMSLFGIPGFIAGALQAMVWFVYGIGMAQWFSGRGFKEYQ